MTKQNSNTKKGFTIIEVVLVLAIAGLIFLMVFVALPALQRSQRDTQRRDDMGRLVTAIQNWQSTHKNKVPDSADTLNGTFTTDYLKAGENGDDSFDDPSTGSPYEFTYVDCSSATECSDTASADEAQGTIHAYKKARCSDGDNPIEEDPTGANKMAFTIKMEGAGVYCVSN